MKTIQWASVLCVLGALHHHSDCDTRALFVSRFAIYSLVYHIETDTIQIFSVQFSFDCYAERSQTLFRRCRAYTQVYIISLAKDTIRIETTVEYWLKSFSLANNAQNANTQSIELIKPNKRKNGAQWSEKNTNKKNIYK